MKLCGAQPRGTGGSMSSQSATLIQRISKKYDFQAFNCGEESLNRFFRQFAWQNDSIGLSRVFVAAEHDEARVKGYYTLSNGSVTFEAVPEPKKGWPRQQPVPITLMGRLAVDLTVQKQGIGEILLVDALNRALRASEDVASYAVVVDALHDAAERFYLKYGFQRLLDKSLHLFIPMDTIRQL
jgi:GNAT superfamily N-acetyltransferase